jgi:hypothetical protein
MFVMFKFKNISTDGYKHDKNSYVCMCIVQKMVTAMYISRNIKGSNCPLAEQIITIMPLLLVNTTF